MGESGSGLVIAGTNLGLVGQLREVGEEPGDEHCDAEMLNEC